MQLHETVYGKNFFEYQLPELIEAIKGVGEQIKKQNELAERSNELIEKQMELTIKQNGFTERTVDLLDKQFKMNEAVAMQQKGFFPLTEEKIKEMKTESKIMMEEDVHGSSK